MSLEARTRHNTNTIETLQRFIDNLQNVDRLTPVSESIFPRGTNPPVCPTWENVHPPVDPLEGPCPQGRTVGWCG